MAHELGHALGLRHVDDPQAVMHAFMGEQDITPLVLSRDDIDILAAACRRHEDG
jgi:predicted Zn-dependent protease